MNQTPRPSEIGPEPKFSIGDMSFGPDNMPFHAYAICTAEGCVQQIKVSMLRETNAENENESRWIPVLESAEFIPKHGTNSLERLAAAVAFADGMTSLLKMAMAMLCNSDIIDTLELAYKTHTWMYEDQQSKQSNQQSNDPV